MPTSVRLLATAAVGALAFASGPPQAAAAPITFRDLAADPASGISLPSDLYEAAAWTDADGDGRLDFYLTVFSTENLLFVQTAGRAFAEEAGARGCSDPATSLGGYGALFADFDNDGDADLYLSNGLVDFAFLAQENRLFRNDGGLFTDVTAAAGLGGVPSGRSCAAADYDLDGRLDLFCAVPYAITGSRDRLFRNEGGLTFRDVTDPLLTTAAGSGRCASFDPNYNGVGAAWQDYDRDGDPDLFVANNGRPELCNLPPPFSTDCQENWLFRNLTVENFGVPGFRNVACDVGIAVTGMPSFGGSWGDFDNDGWPDLYVTNGIDINGIITSFSPNALFRNQGNGTFARVPDTAGVDDPASSFGSTWGDYDNDGLLDLFVADSFVNAQGTPPPDPLFRNEGGGRFADHSTLAGIADEGIGQGAAFADWNGDGFLDILVANYRLNAGNPGSHVWTSSADNGAHWLHLDLQGVETNRDAIGARVTVSSASHPLQYREVVAGNGYLSQDSRTVETGLGADTLADRVEIRWPVPADCVQTLCDVAADQRLAIVQACDPPVAADAGADRTVEPDEPTTLGGAPTGAFGSCPLSYRWTCDPPATLDLTDPANPVFSASAPGDYTCTADVSDALGATATDVVVVTVAAPALWVHRALWNRVPPLPPALFPLAPHAAVPAGDRTWTEAQPRFGDLAARVLYYDVHVLGVPDPDPANPPQLLRVVRPGGDGPTLELRWN